MTLAEQVPHDIGIGAQLVVVLEVAEAIHAKDETLGLVPDVVHVKRSACPGGEEITLRAS